MHIFNRPQRSSISSNKANKHNKEIKDRITKCTSTINFIKKKIIKTVSHASSYQVIKYIANGICCSFFYYISDKDSLPPDVHSKKVLCHYKRTSFVTLIVNSFASLMIKFMGILQTVGIRLQVAAE